MNTFTPSEQEQRKVESIRRQYIPANENQLEKIKKLDSKVKRPGKIISYILGIAGALIFGFGMSTVMLQGSFNMGLFFGIVGLVMVMLTYPIYKGITNKRKKQYASEIIQLSNNL